MFDPFAVLKVESVVEHRKNGIQLPGGPFLPDIFPVGKYGGAHDFSMFTADGDQFIVDEIGDPIVPKLNPLLMR